MTLTRVVLVLLSAFGLCLSATARAADTVVMLSIQDGMAQHGGKLDGSVKFYFGRSAAPKILQRHGNFVTNKKTNAFGKSEGAACNWAFLSALISLQDRAKSVGANAVVNIASYYKKVEVWNDAMYECHKGGLIAGVALKGDVVRVAR